MGFGIVEPGPLGIHVPGTANLIEEDGHCSGAATVNDIILVPQPSNSPRDPLNWPLWKKDLALFCICLNSAFAGILGPVISTMTAVLVKEFHTDFHHIEIFSGYPLFTSGVGALLASVGARLWGKRPAYLVCSALTFASTVWSAKVTSLNSFLGARLVQGFGLGAFEGVVLSTIGDMYFVHQRGRRVSFLAMMSLATTYFSPIIGGYITDKYGWRMQFWVLTAFTAIGFIVLVLFCPETAYDRPIILETDVIGDKEVCNTSDEKQAGTSMIEASDIISRQRSGSPTVAITTELPRTWLEEMMPFRGRFSKENPFILLARPFICMLFPAVLWAFTFGGTFSAWMIASAIVLARLFAPPPFLFTPTKLGYLWAFPTVGAVCSFILSHLLMDRSSKWLARKNNRVFEPEFRLILVIPTLLIGIPGLVAFGWYADTANPVHGHVNWVVISVIFGLIAFAAVSALSCAFTYLLDAHRDISVETTVGLILIRNFFFFGSSFFMGPWLALNGSKKTYGAIAGIQSAFIVLSVLMYVFGKVIRLFMHRHNPLILFHVQLQRS